MGIRTLLLAGMPCIFGAASARAQRTQFKPAWNLFSPQQDVELGKSVAADAERQLPPCNAPKVDAYLTRLGTRLVGKLPTRGVTYPFEFHCVNDKEINAFALPGGFVFVNRGAIEVSDNEAELAGILAHELAHVALRHGTAEASKAKLAEFGQGLAATLLGGNAGGALMANLESFVAGGVLLRYSRSSETQADVVGTQVLYDAGHDPRALAQFFEKLEEQSKGQNPPEFFSDHPSPGHRVERVQEEIQKLGGVPKDARKDSPEFEVIKREVRALPVAKRELEGPRASMPKPSGPPPLPSRNFAEYQGNAYAVKYPDNWKMYGEKDSVTFTPDGGVVQDSNGQAGLAYGIIVDVAKPQGELNATNALDSETQKLIETLKKDNPKMSESRPSSRVRVNGQPALSTYLDNESPLGGAETDWLITVIRPQGLVYFLCVAPQKDYDKYDRTFSSILDSVKFSYH
ncbi:MAG TPA: M48 family metalloprotease [Candidatus Methylomirabilis sp.]|nr:M48 family metalloprotease [Candidatus Methylomirabilis sp.]